MKIKTIRLFVSMLILLGFNTAQAQINTMQNTVDYQINRPDPDKHSMDSLFQATSEIRSFSQVSHLPSTGQKKPRFDQLQSEDPLALPFFEDFEEIDALDRWIVEDRDGDGNSWIISFLEPKSGDWHAQVRWNDDVPNDDWLISPLLDLPDQPEITLSLWARSYDDWYLESFDIAIISEDGETVNIIASERDIPDEYIEYVYDLSSYRGQVIRFAIVCVSDDKLYLQVDDISVTASEDDDDVVSTTAGGNWSETSTWIGGVVPAEGDDVIIDGPVIIDGTKTINNLHINAGGLLENSYGRLVLEVEGDLVNEGVIRNRPDTFGNLSVNVYKDIVNTGEISCNTLTMAGDDDQTISGDGEFSMSYFRNSNSNSAVITGSELTFESIRIQFNDGDGISGTLKLNHSLFLKSGTKTHQIIIDGQNNTIYGKGRSTFDTESVISNAVLADTIEITSQSVVFDEGVINKGIIENSYSHHVLQVEGDFVNEGIIRNRPGTFGSLSVNVYKDIVNTGEISCNTLTMAGDDDQTISGDGEFSMSYFRNSNSNSAVITGSELTFESIRIQFNDGDGISGTLKLNHSLFLKSGTKTHQIIIDGQNNTIYGKGRSTFDTESVISNAVLADTIEITSQSVVFDEGVINKGIIENSYSHHVLQVEGDFVNEGIIRNRPSTFGSLSVNVYKDIVNTGEISCNTLTMAGEINQSIEIADYDAITSQVVFHSNLDTGGPYQWKKDGVDIDGANSQNLTFINGLSIDDFGIYTCVSSGQTSRSIEIKQEITSIPTVSTNVVTNITSSSAITGGNATSEGITPVTARGVVWNTEENPTIDLTTKTSDGSGTGSFTSNITGLTPNTTYYVRAYATNSGGTAYGNQITFTTLEDDDVDWPAGLIAHWELDEGSGNVLYDSKGNYNAIALGTSWNLPYLDLKDIGSDDPHNPTNPDGNPMIGITNPGTSSYSGTGNYNLDFFVNNPETDFSFEIVIKTYDILQNYRQVILTNYYSSVMTDVNTNTYFILMITNDNELELVFNDRSGHSHADNITLDSSWNDAEFVLTFVRIHDTIFVLKDDVEILSVTNSDIAGSDLLTHGNSKAWSVGGMYRYRAGGIHYFCSLRGQIKSISLFGETEDDNGDDDDWPRDTETTVVDVTSPTGRVWMDRNLGASRAATSSTDSEAYGDLYQWGRAADGHQKRNSPTTTTLSSTDQPGHGSFILAPNDPWDWRNPQNDDLWQGVNGINNPCPTGYRLPTEAEWRAEITSWASENASGAFNSPLKLPMAGGRGNNTGSLLDVGYFSYYWASTVSGSRAWRLSFSGSSVGTLSIARAAGFSVRCLKHEDDLAILPELTTAPVTDITATSAISGGEITDAGSSEISARGVVWSTDENPTRETNDGITTDNSGLGEFTSSITGLTPETTYLVRAYATNNEGTAYGNQVSFTTESDGDDEWRYLTSGSTANLQSVFFIDENTGWIAGWNNTLLKTTDGGTTWSSSNNGIEKNTNDVFFLTPDLGWAAGWDGITYKTTDGGANWTANNTGHTTINQSLYFIDENIGFIGGNWRIYKTVDGGATWTEKLHADVQPQSIAYINGTLYTCGRVVTGKGKIYRSTDMGENWSEVYQSPMDNDHLFSITFVDSNTGYAVGYNDHISATIRGYVLKTTDGGDTWERIYENEDHYVSDIFFVSSQVGYASGGRLGGKIWKTTDGGANWSEMEYDPDAPSNRINSIHFPVANLGFAAGSSGTVMKLETTGPQISIPTVTTNTISAITETTAVSGGNVTNDGNTTLTARGVVWSTDENPTLESNDGMTTDGESAGEFTSTITGLTANTTYYVRAYATNSEGTAYGQQETFTTASSDDDDSLLTDVDGNVYKTVQIGTQQWMAEDLRVSKFNNSDAINEVTDNDAWKDLDSPAWSWYENNSDFQDVYGKLYNGYVTRDSRNVCPTGWHVPTRAEWDQLADYLGGDDTAGGMLKDKGTELWNDPNTGATDTYGFGAVPGGFRYLISGVFQDMGIRVYYWTSEGFDELNSYNRNLYRLSARLASASWGNTSGAYIRCVADDPAEVTPPALANVDTTYVTESTINTISSVVHDGGSHVTRRGVVWSTTSAPVLESADGYTEDGIGMGLFRSYITGLSASTEYYIRAYAENEKGVSYGEEAMISSGEPGEGIVSDRDGNTYLTLMIGDQIWLNSNLKTTRYVDGTSIVTDLDDTAWRDTRFNNTGAYAVYPHDEVAGIGSAEEMKEAYGLLYNWHAVNADAGLCPAGYKVPDEDDWLVLRAYLEDDFGVDHVNGYGNALKSCRQVNSPLEGDCDTTVHPRWDSDDTHFGADLVGFGALPAGERTSSGTFRDLGNKARFWLDSPDFQRAYHLTMRQNAGVVYTGRDYKEFGLSVRCLYDEDYDPTSAEFLNNGEGVITEFKLHGNYPNPFNPGTSILFDIPETGQVSVEIYNSMGQRMAVVQQGSLQAGRHTIQVDAGRWASGIYLYVIRYNNEAITGKMTLIK